MNRLIINQIYWRDGVGVAVASTGVAGVSTGLLPQGLVSGATVRVGVGVA